MILRARIVKPGILGLAKRDLQDCGRTGIHDPGASLPCLKGVLSMM